MTATPTRHTLRLRRLTCARCGTDFDCGTGDADGGCWCMEEAYRLPMPQRGGADCLCPVCLRATATTSEQAGRIA